VGLAPTGKRRLVTAHVEIGPSVLLSLSQAVGAKAVVPRLRAERLSQKVDSPHFAARSHLGAMTGSSRYHQQRHVLASAVASGSARVNDGILLLNPVRFSKITEIEDNMLARASIGEGNNS
jgi:hypothetical protein